MTHAALTALSLDSANDAPAPAVRAPAAGKTNATSRLAPRLILRRAEGDVDGVQPDAEAAVSDAAAGTGSALPTPVRDRFEQSLGADLSSVRVHTGGASATAAAAVGAQAYAVGDDIHFGAGKYQPDDPFGLHLLAHEVAHTVQQRGGTPERQHKLAVSGPTDRAEVEADRAADAMVSGQPFALAGAAPALHRVKSLAEAADKGADTMVDDVLPNSAISKIDTVGDRASAQALQRIIQKDMRLVDEGLATGQITVDVKATNTQILGALENYLSDADGQAAQLGTFKTMFSKLTGDMGRLNGMMSSMDLGSLKDLKDKDSGEAMGADLLSKLFGGADIGKLKAKAMEVDKSLGADFDKLEVEKAQISTLGDQAQQVAGTSASDTGALQAALRRFHAKASVIKDPAAMKAIEAAKKKAENDIAGALQGVLKDAVMGGVGGASKGPAGAAKAAGGAAAKGLWAKVIKPKVDKELEAADIRVGAFPDKSKDKDAAQADAQAWTELQGLQTEIAKQRDKVRAQLNAFGSAVELYEQARDSYQIHMIETGRKLDAALASSQKKMPTREELCKQVCGNEPPPKPAPGTKEKPRFETLMQFVGEADKFIAQAEATKKEGEEELLTKKADGTSRDNAAGRAHDQLEKLTKGDTAPRNYWVINTRKKGDKTWYFAQSVPFKLNHGANPGSTIDGGPNEAQTWGSAEGGAYGANANIKAQVEAIPAMIEKIKAFRDQIGGAMGL